jgi:glycosyltransferase involved in cell wall biosynthesis
MKKKKIAFLSTQFKEVQSGPGRFTEYLRTLTFERIEIHFFSQQIPKKEPFLHPVPIPVWATRIPFSSFFRAWFFKKALENTDPTEKFDWILAADYSMAMFLNEASLKKTAVMVNDDNFLLSHSERASKGKLSWRTWLSRKLGYFLEGSVVRKSAFSIANSDYTLRLMEDIYQPKTKPFLLYKAVDTSWFQYQERPVAPPRIYLFVKNDWKRGGLDLILLALAKLPKGTERTIRIAGIGQSSRPEVEKIISESGFTGKVNLQGLVNRDQLKELLQGSDLFLNFSHQEALGVSCLEAMASGLPVLASDAGGLKEVLDQGKAGCMVPTGDLEALTQMLHLVDENPQILQEKAKNGREQAALFSVENLRSNMESLFG